MKPKFNISYERTMKETIQELNIINSNYLKKVDEIITKELTKAYAESQKYGKKTTDRIPKRKK
jgi:hypothetical protein